MNLRRKSKLHVEVSTHSLNDIMFFLLLFFLIVSTLVSPNVIKLILPNADSGKAVSKKTITLSVNAEKNYFIDNEPVPYEQLELTLQNLLGKIDEPTVILKVDKGLEVQELVDVLEIGNRLKIKMVLATQAGKK
jgi:biopolymer transport protein ExbD